MVRSMTTSPDRTRLVERLAAQYAASGVTHPVAAAVAVACRGNASLELEAFARERGLDVAQVRACEAGEVAFGELPAALVEDHDGLDLLTLADLAATYASRRNVGEV
jgi:hypothetical protein